MDVNGLNFRMLSQQQDWLLPVSPSPGASDNMSSLETGIGSGDTQIVLLTPLPGGPPAFVLVDSEVMSVNAVDPTGLQLGVTRGAMVTRQQSLCRPFRGRGIESLVASRFRPAETILPRKNGHPGGRPGRRSVQLLGAASSRLRGKHQRNRPCFNDQESRR